MLWRPSNPQSSLERILSSRSLYYDDLPRAWKLLEARLRAFSPRKELFDYQREALKSTTQLLHFVFSGWRQQRDLKARLLEAYESVGFDPSPFHYYQKKHAKLFCLYREHFPIREDCKGNAYVPAKEFLNRACYWMATGSGKSLVLIKVIELLDRLMREGLVPRRDLLLLVPRDDLIEQYKKHIEEYNESNPERPIHHYPLTDYDKDSTLLRNEYAVNLFYYRSDLLRSERKDKIIDYKDYLNPEDGRGLGTNDLSRFRWYVFLDEAHMGEKDNSNMQGIVHALSRDGFMFNFSATFVEPLDYATTCFNFNLERFIGYGYGKHIYIDPKQMNAFKTDEGKKDFSEEEKRKQVLKSLLIFAAIKSSRKEGTYHAPLMVVFTNTVNPKAPSAGHASERRLSDLWMFFEELVRIAGRDIPTAWIEKLKQELVEDSASLEGFVYGSHGTEAKGFQEALQKALAKVSVPLLREMVFNGPGSGRLEYQEGEQGREIVLKLENVESPFGLIRIGNTSGYKKVLEERGYVRTKAPLREKVFETLEASESPVTMLMGSRTFYLGWDSNRPNVMNFVNIGQKDAKKFSVQALGRGVRIQPRAKATDSRDTRKRLDSNDEGKNPLMETLYVFATDKSAMRSILKHKDSEVEGKESRLNPHPEQNPKTKEGVVLLYPKYDASNAAESKVFLVDGKGLNRFRAYMNAQGPSLLVLKHVNDLATKKPSTEDGRLGAAHAIHLRRLLELRNPNKQSNLVRKDNQGVGYRLMGDMLSHLMEFQTMETYVSNDVQALGEGVIGHFRNITVSLPEAERRALEVAVKQTLPSSGDTQETLKKQLRSGGIGIDEYTERVKAIGSKKKTTYESLVLDSFLGHYYCPLVYKEPGKKMQFRMRNIIHEESESLFVQNLLGAVNDKAIDLGAGTHWFFSKIVDRVDQVKIPYIQGNQAKNFYPDFVFWVWNEHEYRIVFVDPKGTEHTKYEGKVDGYEKLFREEGNVLKRKEFRYKKWRVTVDLKMVTDDMGDVRGEKYKPYWVQNNCFDFLKI